jgi:hypothetical protein
MQPLELMERLGAEFLNNKIRTVIDGKIVILARMSGADWVYTDEGQALANSHSNVAVEEVAEEEASAEPKRGKKSKHAVELADVEPEL